MISLALDNGLNVEEAALFQGGLDSNSRSLLSILAHSGLQQKCFNVVLEGIERSNPKELGQCFLTVKVPFRAHKL
jgi:hypothetical protein